MTRQLGIQLLLITLLAGCGNYQNTVAEESQYGANSNTPKIAVVGDLATVTRIKDSLGTQVGASQGVSGMGVGGNSDLDTWIVISFANSGGLNQFQSWAASQKTYHFEAEDGYALLYISNTQAVRVYTQITGNIQAR